MKELALPKRRNILLFLTIFQRWRLKGLKRKRRKMKRLKKKKGKGKRRRRRRKKKKRFSSCIILIHINNIK